MTRSLLLSKKYFTKLFIEIDEFPPLNGHLTEHFNFIDMIERINFS